MKTSTELMRAALPAPCARHQRESPLYLDLNCSYNPTIAWPTLLEGLEVPCEYSYGLAITTLDLQVGAYPDHPMTFLFGFVLVLVVRILITEPEKQLRWKLEVSLCSSGVGYTATSVTIISLNAESKSEDSASKVVNSLFVQGML